MQNDFLNLDEDNSGAVAKKKKPFTVQDVYSVNPDSEISVIPGQSDDLEKDLAFVSNFQPGVVSGQQEYDGWNFRFKVKTLEQLRNNVLPRKKSKQIEKALEWSKTDDLLIGLLKIKTDFSVMGFNLSCKPIQEVPDSAPNSTEESESVNPDELRKIRERTEFQRDLDRISKHFGFYQIAKNLLDDWYACDNMILYWKVDNSSDSGESGEDTVPTESDKFIPGLRTLFAIKPSDVDWVNSLGMDILKVKIPVDLKDMIKAVLIRRNKELVRKGIDSLLKRGVPEKYIDAVKNNQDWIELKRDEGDNWIIKTTNRKHSGLANPSMYSIFVKLAIRSMLNEGEFSASFMMKHFILQAKMGESITQGPMAGSRNNYPSQDDLDNMTKALRNVNKSAVFSTNHTVEFNFVHPPKEIFSDEKFVSANNAVYNWAGISVVLSTGEGGTYSGGFLSAKRVVAHIADGRREIDDCFEEFFNHETITSRIKKPEDCTVSASFDENALKEPRQLLEELKFVVQQGMGDPRMTLKELGRDPDQYKRSKSQSQIENTKTGVWEPIYVSTTPFPNQGGRPVSDGNEIDEESITQSPTSS